ncbi:UNVERIFIED_CONTAM: hypothetical protein FKN15_059642 [Acipenser sinensis]
MDDSGDLRGLRSQRVDNDTTQTSASEGLEEGETCMGKDVTLHVSASNPAMLLYQKFGFKTAEYILD